MHKPSTIKTQYRVDVIESESGYGQRLEFSKYFEDIKMAEDYIHNFGVRGDQNCYTSARGPYPITYDTKPIKKKILRTTSKKKDIKKTASKRKTKLAQDSVPTHSDYEEYRGSTKTVCANGYYIDIPETWEDHLINGKDPDGPLS